MSATFAFVHGAFGSPAELAPAAPYLESRGHSVVNVDLPSERPDATLDDYAKAEGCCPTLITDRIRLTFLAPDIVEMILQGRQSGSLTIANLKRSHPLPLSWEEQHELLQGSA
jgi:hypothetical protein